MAIRTLWCYGQVRRAQSRIWSIMRQEQQLSPVVWRYCPCLVLVATPLLATGMAVHNQSVTTV
jgi:hypothetical protein